jgi:rhodanese-related sulfurtransferase
MNYKLKDILLIISISTLVGIGRSFILGDISLIKYPINPISSQELSDNILDGPRIIKLDQCKLMFDNRRAIFIDARDSLLFLEGHILGAINIHFESSSDDRIIEKLDGISNDNFLIIYCSGGDCDLSEELGNHLFEYLSYTNILLYEGGFPEWQGRGYPVENE